MTRRHLTRACLGLALACAVIAQGSAAQAQVEEATRTADPGRIQDQFRDMPMLPDVSPRIEVRDLVLQKVPAGAENVALTLNSLELEGVTAYTADQLAPVYKNKLGQTISLADVYAISTALTNKYRNDGYILTQVIVPPQTIENGRVRLQVVEGFVDSVTVEGPDSGAALELLQTYGSHIQSGKALNVMDLERYLLLINDMPGVDARSILSPSRTRTGAADLRIITTRDPFDAMIGIDNHGSRYLGPLQVSTAASLNNYFGVNDRLTGQLVIAPDLSEVIELAYVAVAYEQPIYDNGTMLEFFMSLTDTEPGYNLDDFDVEGRAMYYSVKAEHPFIRSRALNLYGHVLFDWRDVESKNNLEPTREDRIRAVRAGGRLEFLDTLFGVGINSAQVEFAQGLNIFGSSEEGDMGLTRPNGDPQFFKVEAEVQRLQRVTNKVNLLVAAKGQLSSDELLASEEFGVGGIQYGRGFDPSEIVGDEGVAGKVELQWNKPVQWNFVQDYQVFSFFDAGRVWDGDATANSLKTDTLTSAGVGLRADFKDQTEAGVTVAFPLNRDIETQQDKDPRFYMHLNRRF